jgi:hypothetical protein
MRSRVLMIEDKPEEAKRTLKALSRIGVEDVLWARDDDMGLRLMRDEGMVPSLLLLHHHVSGAHDRLLNELHRDAALSAIPVVTVDSGEFQPQDLDVILRTG